MAVKKDPKMVSKDPKGVDVMLAKIRAAVGSCTKPSEKEVYEALVEEASGWHARLDELLGSDPDDEDEDEPDDEDLEEDDEAADED